RLPKWKKSRWMIRGPSTLWPVSRIRSYPRMHCASSRSGTSKKTTRAESSRRRKSCLRASPGILRRRNGTTALPRRRSRRPPDGWVPASELADRYVRLGRPAEGVSKTHIEFEGEVEGDFVYRNKVGRSDISKQRHQQLGTRSLQIKPVKARAQLDETTGWFFGMYLAEGEINPELRSVRFTLGLHEEVYANRLTTILRERFGVGAEITHVIDAPTSWLTVR